MEASESFFSAITSLPVRNIFALFVAPLPLAVFAAVAAWCLIKTFACRRRSKMKR